MTPEQAYNMLSEMIGRPILYLKVTNALKQRMFIVYSDTPVNKDGPYDSVPCRNIEWGDLTEYKPPKWRPATVEDAIRALKGEKVTCRVKQTTDTDWVWENVPLVSYVHGINMPWFVTFGPKNVDVLRYQECEVLE